MNELLSIVIERNHCPKGDEFTIRFRAWAPILPSEVEKLTFVGQLMDEPSPKLVFDERSDFWSPHAKISASQYPYSSCDVYHLPETADFFLVYSEFGGHSKELRCRYFDPSLVVC